MAYRIARSALRPLLVSLAALALAVAPASARAQAGDNVDIITGTVVGPEGQPLAGARVEATSAETGVTRAKTTNAKGEYTILFPDGGGSYRITVRMLGMSPTVVALARQADEDRLVQNIRMSRNAAQLSTVVVRANTNRNPTERPEPGSTERAMSGQQLERMPVDPSDPNAIAALVPGVVSITGSDSTAAGFSVAGQRPDQNQVTLDGLSFGAGGVPTEAVRSTRVVTNTYDVSRGQFTGGQVATTTRGGTNDLAGSFAYSLRDPSLEWTDEQTSPTGITTPSGAYTQHQISGGIGGPIVPDKAFYFIAFQGRRRLEPVRSLMNLDRSTLSAYGIASDSAQRFLQLVQGYGFPLTLSSIPDDQTRDNGVGIIRLDWHVTDDQSLMFRGDLEGGTQRASRIGTLTLPSHGGSNDNGGGGAMLSLSSVFDRFLNEFRGYYSRNSGSGDPYLTSPDARVTLESQLDNGVLGVTGVNFGGNPGLPTENGGEQLEVSDEASLLAGGTSHRYRLGALLNLSDFDQTINNNRFGTFSFNSLEDFADNTPTSFTRALSSGARSGGAVNGAIYAGDTWRHSRQLQVTYGLRGEATTYRGAPAYNPDVEAKFGVRTDRFPTEFHVSPRVGFTWMVGGGIGGDQPAGGPNGQAGDRGGRGGRGGFGGGRGGFGGGGFGGPGGAGGAFSNIPSPFIIRGGIGEFRGRAPTSLFASAQTATGLANGETQLTCIGAAVPTPDWAAYLADPSLIPTTCADGGAGSPAPGASTAPNVTVIDPGFAAPRSWRASLGVSRRFFTRYQASLDASYALGTKLYGVRDLNFNDTPQFQLADEGNRPVYVSPSSIIPTTGATTLAASRRDDAYGYVFDATSQYQSHSSSVTGSIGGASFSSLIWSLSYTFTDSRDQSSFYGGSALGGFGSATTAGDPNVREWAVSDFQRRHQFNGSTTWLARSWLDVTSYFRVSSGAPFTPRVAADINGDGVRNDRAFVFPTTVGDTAIANGMARLLRGAPSQVRSCLLSQTGTVAARNSCYSDWTASLDFQANIRPNLGKMLQRRVQLSLSFNNALAGIDQLVHGADNLHGWGQNAFADPTLLYVRGFDPLTNEYQYTVNERFGSNATARAGIRQPFQIGITARVQVGPDRDRERLEAFVRGDAGGNGFSIRNIIGRVAPDPTAAIVELRDSLKLTDDQVAKLHTISDSLSVKNDTMAAQIQRQVGDMVKGGATLMSIFPKIQPRLQEARNNFLAAVKQAQGVLTPEQWNELPESVRNPTMQRGPGGGRRGGGSGGPPSR